jgi:hypothetical protein
VEKGCSWGLLSKLNLYVPEGRGSFFGDFHIQQSKTAGTIILVIYD